ncbi:hypothetical protein EON70_00345 [bacterium]|nr:MAG: hypothetical protein EON70_00345 [bacterium]
MVFVLTRSNKTFTNKVVRPYKKIPFKNVVRYVLPWTTKTKLKPKTMFLVLTSFWSSTLC